MAQAKTLTQAEIDQVLRYVAGTRYAQRNRTMVLASVWSDMRVGEIAALHVCDAVNADGTVKNEIRLTAEQTKGRCLTSITLAAVLPHKEMLLVSL